ncbi:MAG: Dabb family protein [Hormoscilla sp. SP12CHS1]|nr:Dabb family protein [Hormoscilla sp. SP12CHS1]
MIEHIVLFKWQQDASPEAIASVMDGLLRLKAKIPEIIDLSCGDNFSERGQGFQHGLVVRLASQEALKSYQDHPAHQKVKQNLILPILTENIAVDYEIM